MVKNKTNQVKQLIHRGTGGQQGWIYSINGVIATIPASTYKDPPKIVVIKENKNADSLQRII